MAAIPGPLGEAGNGISEVINPLEAGVPACDGTFVINMSSITTQHGLSNPVGMVLSFRTMFVSRAGSFEKYKSDPGLAPVATNSIEKSINSPVG